jgi:adenylylsulfate kinase-like enzyme
MAEKLQPVIEFSTFIVAKAPDFTGRAWIFRAVNDWLSKEETSRCFLLTGDPGSGKSAIAARLCQFSAGEIFSPDGLWADCGNRDGLEEALGLTDAIGDKESRVRVLGALAEALARTGNLNKASQAFRLAFNIARAAGRSEVFIVLGHQLKALAGLKQWQTLETYAKQ